MNDKKRYYKIGDCVFKMDHLPRNFHPATAFVDLSYLNEWLKHEKFAYNALLLTLMYANHGSIRYYAPKCPECSRKMKFVENSQEKDFIGKKTQYIPHFKCSGHGHTKQASMVKECSTYFRFLKGPRQLIKFFKFCTYYFDTSSSIKDASFHAEISCKTGYKWALKIRDLFTKKRENDNIQLGDNGSTLEMDGTHIEQDWKYKAGAIPKDYHGTIWFRVIERDWTEFGRHRRLTKLVRSESIKNCLEFMKENCKKGSRLMADGCGFGAS